MMQTRYPEKIVFVCHEATRTGVPLLLLKLIEWLGRSNQTESFVILVKGGSLRLEFEQVSKVFVWNPEPPDSTGTISRALSAAKNFCFRRVRRSLLKRSLNEFSAEVLYVNTSAALPFIQANLDIFNSMQIFLHCHEMPWSIDRYVPDKMKSIFSSLAGVIVVNNWIREFFLDRGVAQAKMLLVTEYFPKELKGDWSPPSMFTVVSAGLGSWRKGIDLFVQVAFHFSRIYDAPFVFKWTGFVPDLVLSQCIKDAEAMGIGDRVEFTGELSDVSSVLKSSDVFLLSSREDSYPLVMLEAASFALPILYFDQTGGASDFVADADLAVVPYDVVSMAAKLRQLAQDVSYRKVKGDRLASRVRNHTVEHVGASIFDFICSDCLKRRGGI